MILNPRIIHTFDEILLAFQEASQSSNTLVLSTVEGAIAFAGVGYYLSMLKHAKSIYPQVNIKFIFDCTNSPGWAISALRQGARCISFKGNAETTEKISRLAEIYNAEIIIKEDIES